ncbi:MAG: tetratricopeptide repeat protein, partial [Myxococcota bacterium]
AGSPTRYNTHMTSRFWWTLGLAAGVGACSSVPAGLSTGDALVEKGRCDDAVEAYSRAIEEDPTLVDALLGRGRCYVELEKFDQAAESFAAALEFETTERTLVPLAKVRTAQAKYDRADGLFVQLVALAENEDDRRRYQRELAELRMAAGNVGEAISVLRQLLRDNPDDNAGRIALGRALVLTNQFDEAIKMLTEALSVARDNDALQAPLICEIGRAMESIERYADALRSYRWCGSLDKSFAPAVVGEGRLLRKKRDVEAAINHLKAATTTFPDSAELHYELGLALRDYSVFDQAVQELEIAVALDPSFDDTYVPLLDLLADEVRDPKRRYAVLNQAAVPLGDNFDVQLDLGRAATRRREFQPARAALERAISITPNHAEANFYLGVVQAATGELEEATATVEALGVISPEQALELSEIVNETRKGADPVKFLGGESGKAAVGRNVKGRLQKRESNRRRAAAKRAKRGKKRKKRRKR